MPNKMKRTEKLRNKKEIIKEKERKRLNERKTGKSNKNNVK